MSNRSFSDISQKQWKKACKKLGLEIKTKSGKGSHILVCHPFINIKIFKKLLKWGFSEDQIWGALN